MDDDTIRSPGARVACLMLSDSGSHASSMDDELMNGKQTIRTSNTQLTHPK